MILRIFLLLLVLSPVLVNVSAMATEMGTEAATSEQSHADGHDSHHLNWFDFNESGAPPVIALLVNFVCLFFIVYWMLRKSLSARFKNRKMSLEKELAEAKMMKQQAEAALALAREKVKTLDTEMAKIRAEIIETGKSEATRITEDAKEQGERLRSDALAMVEQEISRMGQSIRKEVVEEAVAMAGQIIQQRMEKSDHDRIINTYVGAVGDNRPSVPPDR